MKENLHRFWNKYRVELVVIPPIFLGIAYAIYGVILFSSIRITISILFPWVLFSLTSSNLCNWWMRTMYKQFSVLEDWWKRLIFSILGYVSIHIVCYVILFVILKKLWIEAVILQGNKLFAVAALDFSTLILMVTLYEGVTYFGKWKEAISETEQLEKLNLESQFRSLQSQLNPHFLFNSFNVLSSLIMENPRRAEDFVDELSNVYRYLLRSNEQELATVGEETRFIHSFFHLLETRHDQGVSLSVKVPEMYAKRRLPALALQILVENAVKHNEIAADKPLQIDIEAKDGALIVRNNIQRKKTKVASNRVGLSNLQQRYELLGIKAFKINDDQRFFEAVLPLI